MNLSLIDRKRREHLREQSYHQRYVFFPFSFFLQTSLGYKVFRAGVRFSGICLKKAQDGVPTGKGKTSPASEGQQQLPKEAGHTGAFKAVAGLFIQCFLEWLQGPQLDGWCVDRSSLELG